MNKNLLSDQFDNSLKQLENEKESKEYISEYIIRAKNYVKFFSQEDKKAEKNNEDEDWKDNKNIIYFYEIKVSLFRY